MNYIKIIENFVDRPELDFLNSWSLNNFRNNPNQYIDAFMDPDHPKSRFTTRLRQTENHAKKQITINYPDIAYNIQNRIIENFGLQECKQPPPFYNGIVNGIGFGEGLITEHRDPVFFPNTYTLHCNIISQKSESGGITVIDDVEYDINEGDLLCYLVSEVKHRVTLTKGNRNRILWVFGFCIDDKKRQEII